MLLHAPSSFNSQTARVVLLLGENHTKFWEITKAELKKVSKSDETFKATEQKVDTSFAAGYGTILFFENQTTIKDLQEKFPSIPDKFVQWSEHSAGIVQILTWLGLESVGFGASLQHYNPLIDEAVKKEWDIDQNWELIAQMPFGTPIAEPAEKTIIPVEERLFVFE